LRFLGAGANGAPWFQRVVSSKLPIVIVVVRLAALLLPGGLPLDGDPVFSRVMNLRELGAALVSVSTDP